MLGRRSGTPGPALPPHLAGAACPAVTPTDPCRWCHGDATQAFRERTVLQTFSGFRTQPAVALPAFPGSCPPFGSSTDGPDVTHQLPQPAPLERSPGQTARGAPPLAVWGAVAEGAQWEFADLKFIGRLSWNSPFLLSENLSVGKQCQDCRESCK